MYVTYTIYFQSVDQFPWMLLRWWGHRRWPVGWITAGHNQGMETLRLPSIVRSLGSSVKIICVFCLYLRWALPVILIPYVLWMSQWHTVPSWTHVLGNADHICTWMRSGFVQCSLFIYLYIFIPIIAQIYDFLPRNRLNTIRWLPKSTLARYIIWLMLVT